MRISDWSSDVCSSDLAEQGSFPISVVATDSSTGAGAPYSISSNYTLQVTAPTIVLAPATLPGGAAGDAYSQALTASGGVDPYTFAVTAGRLPAGLGLARDGTLSGTPTPREIGRTHG